MQTLSQRTTCHEQNRQQQVGSNKPDSSANTLRSMSRFILSLIKPAAVEKLYSTHSLSHLSEHQLRDIGFTRESSDRKLPDVNVAFLHYGLHEQRRSQIRRLPKA